MGIAKQAKTSRSEWWGQPTPSLWKTSRFWKIEVPSLWIPFISSLIPINSVGWTRSGRYIYHPVLSDNCCPHYQIRLDAKSFQPTQSQKRVLSRIKKYVRLSDKFRSWTDSSAEQSIQEEKLKNERSGQPRTKRSSQQDSSLHRGLQEYFEVALRGVLIETLEELLRANAALAWKLFPGLNLSLVNIPNYVILQVRYWLNSLLFASDFFLQTNYVKDKSAEFSSPVLLRLLNRRDVGEKPMTLEELERILTDALSTNEFIVTHGSFP